VSLDRELARALVAAIREDSELRGELRELLAYTRATDRDADQASPWLSVTEAAEHLRVSERTLQRMAGRGRVRSSTIGRRRLYHRDDLDALARAATGEDVAPATPSRRRGE
jgi:excisionase family DNA binding protein